MSLNNINPLLIQSTKSLTQNQATWSNLYDSEFKK